MKSILFCCHATSVFTLKELHETGDLVGIVVPEKCSEFAHQVAFTARVMNVDILLVSSSDMDEVLSDWITEKSPDVIIVNTFSYKLPAAVLELPKYGGWNFHCGPLPEYRGPMPLYWQILNGDKSGCMTLHQMDSRFDGGKIFKVNQVRIDDFDTHDVALNRLAQEAPKMLGDLFEALDRNSLELVDQDESLANYYQKPNPEDIVINWEFMDSDHICRLVRACNLIAGGALSYFENGEVRIFEAEEISLQESIEEKPGTIVTIQNDPNLYILCRNNTLLKINVLSIPEAVCSGGHFKKMLNVYSGQRFTSQLSG